MEFVVVDIETTGLSRFIHKITEIAAVKVKDGKTIGEFQTLVNPEAKIPRFITELTGIDDEMVADAPKVAEALPNFHDFMEGGTFAAHNATFDYKFIRHYSKKNFINFEADCLCTRRLANRLLPSLRSKSLGSLCNHFRIHNEEAHRALSDARATALILKNFLRQLEKSGVGEVEDILSFQKMTKNQIRRKYSIV